MPNDYYNRVTDYVPGASVRSSDVDAELNAVVAGFDKLGDPTKIGNGGALWGEDTGTPDNYVYDNGGTSALVPGQIITFVPTNTSTGPAVIAYNGGSNITIVRNDGSPVQAGDLIDGVPVMLIYDSVNNRWVLVGATAQQTLEGFRPGILTDATTARTLSATDEGKLILFTNAAAITVTLPNDAAANLAAGFLCHLVAAAAGKVTLSPGGGVTIAYASAPSTRASNSSLSVIKTGANAYLVVGDQG